MTRQLAPVEARGRTTFAHAAVEHIAVVAATEVPGVGGSASRFAGIPLNSEAASRPVHVRARVDDGTASLVVRLSIDYPLPLAATAEAVRGHLVDRIGELTGLRVDRVDITITALHATAPRPGDEGRAVR